MALDPTIANKIATAKTTTGGNKIRRGNYILVVKRIMCEKKYKGTMFIPEFDVIECDAQDPNPEAPEHINVATPNKAGSDCSQAWPMDKGGNAGSAALGNVKQFACAFLGLEEASLTDEQVVEKIGPYVGANKSDPDAVKGRGRIILCQTYDKKIETGANAGKWGTFPRFSHVSPAEGNDDASVAERRAKLDAEKR